MIQIHRVATNIRLIYSINNLKINIISKLIKVGEFKETLKLKVIVTSRVTKVFAGKTFCFN